MMNLCLLPEGKQKLGKGMKVFLLSCNEKELPRWGMKLKGIIKHYLACLVPGETHDAPEESHLLTPLIPSQLDKKRKGGKGAWKLLKGRRYFTRYLTL